MFCWGVLIGFGISALAIVWAACKGAGDYDAMMEAAFGEAFGGHDAD